MRYFITCLVLNISFLCANSGQTLTCTPCSRDVSCKDGPWLQSLPSAQQCHSHAPWSSWCGTWGSKPIWPVAVSAVRMLHLHVCVRRPLLTLSHNSCPSSQHEYSGCNTKVLGGPRGCRKLVLALAVSAWLPVCLRAALGSPLEAFRHALHLHHAVGS